MACRCTCPNAPRSTAPAKLVSRTRLATSLPLPILPTSPNVRGNPPLQSGIPSGQNGILRVAVRGGRRASHSKSRLRRGDPMSAFVRPTAIVAVLSCFAVVGVNSQQNSPLENQPTAAAAARQNKQKQKAKKELGYSYTDWLENEVPYIISPEERSAFLRLGTNEEREQFIEHFWQLRNPDPDSAENSFKEDHYRRIAYANERFSSGVPGRKTDRGHIYILWGPPDEIESHPTGGTYDRPMWQGGGPTTTYPWEFWRYRHLQNIGENVEFEFVDPSGSGEYHLTRDPGEKDALAHVPGAGLSLSEMMFGATKAQRFTNSDGTTLPVPIGSRPSGLNEFESLDRYFRALRPPEHVKDLTSLVSSRVVRNSMRVDYSVDYLRVTNDSVLVPITLQIPNREMS